jgi:hypothetical protein
VKRKLSPGARTIADAMINITAKPGQIAAQRGNPSIRAAKELLQRGKFASRQYQTL